MEDVIVLEESTVPTYADVKDGRHFMLNRQGPIYRKVRWPGENNYVLDITAATIHMESEFLKKEVIMLEVTKPLRVKIL